MYRTKLIPQTRYIIIIILTVGAYWPTFTGNFVLDDNILVKNNPYIKQIHSVYSYFSQEDGIVHKKDLGVFHTGYYRPLINITYFMDFKIWGMNAYGFRITNLILHLLNCFILLKLFDHFIRDRQTAFWCTVLFSVHPVNTEAVSCIVARNNMLAGLFSLLSLYFYVRWTEKKDFLKICVSIIAFFCAIFSKEFGLMILPVFFLYNRFLARNKSTISSEFVSYIPFMVVALIYLFLRHMVVGSVLTPFNESQILQRIYFVPYIIIWNLRLIFLPYGLHQFSFYYPSSLFDLEAIFSFIFLLVIFLFLWVKRNNGLLIFSSFSFLTVLFPVLHIIPSAATPNALISLRWLYFPMFFIFLGFAELIKHKMDIKQTMVKAILCISICYLGIYSYVMNRYHWHDEGTFLTQEVIRFNNSLHVGGLAEYLFEKGKLTEAEKYFNIAVKVLPREAYNYINYSALLIDEKRYDDALAYLDKSKNLRMTNHECGEWYNNRGSALLGLGDFNKALKNLNKAVKIVPDEATFWSNLGGAYGMTGDYEQSVNALKKAVDLSPGLVNSRINLAITYMNLADYRKAISVLEGIQEKERLGNQNIVDLLETSRRGLDRENNIGKDLENN